MASSSLVVRISADLNDFSKQLNAMTKEVDKAADKVKNVGTAMSVAITLPATLAAAALAKLAYQADDTATRMSRMFGANAGNIQQQLQAMTSVVPKTTQELGRMANQIGAFSRGLGMSAPATAAMSTSLVKMAAELGAFSGVGTDEALNALMRGLEGSTRGLKSMGIDLNQAQVQQEAYRLGLLKTGEELTPLGTALATYSLLLKQADNWEGSAAQRAETMAGKWDMAVASLKQAAENLATELTPAITALADDLIKLIKVVQETPRWFAEMAVTVVGLLAVLGPLLVVIANVAKAFALLRAGMALLGGASLLAELNPVVLALTAIAAAVAGVTYLWHLFNQETDKTKAFQSPTAFGGTVTQNGTGVGPLSNMLPTGMPGLLKLQGTGEPTSMQKGSDVEVMTKAASALKEIYESSVESGTLIADTIQKIDSLHSKAIAALEKEKDKTGEAAAGYRKIADELQKISVLSQVAFGGMKPAQASQLLTSPQTLRLNQANADVQYQTSLRTRETDLNHPDQYAPLIEALLQVKEAVRTQTRDLATRQAVLNQPDPYNASATAGVNAQEAQRKYQEDLDTRTAMLQLPAAFKATTQASVELGEQFRKTDQDFQLAADKLSQSWSSASNAGASAMDGLEQGLTGLISALTPAAIVFMAIGKVIAPLMQLLNAVLEPLTAFGRILGMIIQPILYPLFESLKFLGVVASYVGQVLYTVFAAIGHFIGNVIEAIGQFISNIPFLHGVGQSIKTVGKQINQVATDANNVANQLVDARNQLINSNLNAFADATNAATAALLNVPTGFKIALDTFRAMAPQSRSDDVSSLSPNPVPAPVGTGPTNGGSGYGGVSGGQTGAGTGSADLQATLVVDGQTLGRVVVKNLQKLSSQQFGTQTKWSEVSV